MRLEAANVRIVWAPQPGPQHALVDCPFTEVLFGGARGGGKTDGVLGKYAIKALRYKRQFNAVFFRKEMPQADDLVERAKEIYLPLGAIWREQPRQFTFAEGGRVRFRPLENVSDAAKFQGQNLSDAAVEEAGNYADPKPIDMLFGALRSKGGVPIQLILTANPGGVGQQWIKHRYIDPAPRGMKPLVRELPNGATHRYIYIPSRVQDNKILLENDPTYINRLHLVGSPELVRAWLEGDWNVVAGAFFPEFDIMKHVVAPRSLPSYWVKFRSFDWGSARPFSVLWWAVSDGELAEFPRGSMICYREWYGAPKDMAGHTIPNTGLRLTAEEVADGILEREKNDIPSDSKRVMGGVADPSIFSEDGGPSIADRMAARKIFWRPADNSRVGRNGAMGGWDQVRARLKGDGEKAAIYFFATITDLIRTLPSMQHDDDRPEDMATNGEDHCFAGATLFATPKGTVRFDQALSEGLVWDRYGELVPYQSLRMTRMNKPVVSLLFDDGSEVICTPDHRFMSAQKEWVEARNMVDEESYAYIMPPCSKSPLSAGQSRSFAESDTICVADTFSEKESAFTARYGATSTGLFLRAMTSTIRTTIARIISLTTSNGFPNPFMAASTGQLHMRTSSRTLSEGALRQPSGMGAKRAENGTASIGTNPSHHHWRSLLTSYASAVTSLIRPRSPCANMAGSVATPANQRSADPNALMTNPVFAEHVALSSWQTDTARSAHAPEPAEPLCQRERGPVCLSVNDAGRRDVWCLTVPTTSSFLLANGVVVSNCADSARYACMSRPYIAPLPAEATMPEPDRYRRNWKPGKRQRGSSMAA